MVMINSNNDNNNNRRAGGAPVGDSPLPCSSGLPGAGQSRRDGRAGGPPGGGAGEVAGAAAELGGLGRASTGGLEGAPRPLRAAPRRRSCRGAPGVAGRSPRVRRGGLRAGRAAPGGLGEGLPVRPARGLSYSLDYTVTHNNAYTSIIAIFI